jgi:4,5-DOPA dioxygenase extradiol
MPAVFIGHGSPMNALERNQFTDSWRELGTTLPRPMAIVSVSAHWYIPYSAVTAMARPRVIHDFFGFPDELFAFDYPAPGAPDVAEEVAALAKPTWVGLDVDGWGLDHGTWSVLAHLFPSAEVPVVQLSVNAAKPLDYHLELGARLAPLRDRGVLIVGSGNVVHDLRRVDWSQPAGAFDWARRFDEATRQLMTSDPSAVDSLPNHGDYRHAVPTPDHFLPLAYLAGVAAADGAAAEVVVDGYTYGSISMTSYVVGAQRHPHAHGVATAAPLPDPGEVAPEDTNA